MTPAPIPGVFWPATDRLPGMRVVADDLIFDALVEHEPRKVFALYSGGNDSTVLVSVARSYLGQRLDAVVHIDTGTAVPGVREFVEMMCTEWAVPLIVLEAGDAYERMVLQHGMPGPGAHLYPYVWLKERQIDRLVRDHKQHRNDRILLLAGARASESQRRMGKAVPVERDGAQVWANPLIDWTDHDMREYRTRRGLPQSDAAALLHRSGECNCGAYASHGEREMLRSLYPEWFERTIARLERLASDSGLPCARWGERCGARVVTERPGRLCTDCQLFDDDQQAAA